jgi:Holliday junction DNA helicase RuvA
VIGWLRGRLIDVGPAGEALIDVNGVGYRVTVPARVLATAGPVGADVELHVHTRVREDTLDLYGFASRAERQLFEVLLGAHGVGPALALAVLGTLGADGLSRAVAEDDLDMLCSVPGVGRKTAARLVLDLKTKLVGSGSLPPADRFGPTPAASGAGARSEVRAALAELGYAPDEIRRAVDVLDGDGSVQDLLRQALRSLAAAR